MRRGSAQAFLEHPLTVSSVHATDHYLFTGCGDSIGSSILPAVT